MLEVLTKFSSPIASFMAVLVPLVIYKIKSNKAHDKLIVKRNEEITDIRSNQVIIHDKIDRIASTQTEYIKKIDQHIYTYQEQKLQCNKDYQSKQSCKDIRGDLTKLKELRT